jgi:hypothetical protein
VPSWQRVGGNSNDKATTSGRIRELAHVTGRIKRALRGFADAVALGCRGWVGVTIAFQFMEAPHLNTPNGSRKMMRRLREWVTRWMAREDIPVAWIDNFEWSKKTGIHSHAAYAVPQGKAKRFRDSFAVMLAKWAEIDTLPPGAVEWGGRYHTLTPGQVLGWIKYGLKGSVATGDEIAGIRGPKNRAHGYMVPVENQTLMFKFPRIYKTVRMMLAEGYSGPVAKILREASERRRQIIENAAGSMMAEIIRSSSADAIIRKAAGFQLPQIGWNFPEGDE